MHYTLRYTERSVWVAQGIFISLSIEIDAYFIWYFSWIIHLKNSQNLLAQNLLAYWVWRTDWCELNNFAPNIRSSSQLDVVNIKSTSVLISRKRLLIVHSVLSYHISKCGMCKIRISKFLLPAYVRTKNSCAVYSLHPNVYNSITTRKQPLCIESGSIFRVNIDEVLNRFW